MAPKKGKKTGVGGKGKAAKRTKVTKEKIKKPAATALRKPISPRSEPGLWRERITKEPVKAPPSSKGDEEEIERILRKFRKEAEEKKARAIKKEEKAEEEEEIEPYTDEKKEEVTEETPTQEEKEEIEETPLEEELPKEEEPTQEAPPEPSLSSLCPVRQGLSAGTAHSTWEASEP